MILIGTLIGLGIQLTLVTFHGLMVSTTAFLLSFYIIGLILAYKYRGEPVDEETSRVGVGRSTEMSSMIKSSESSSVKKETVYRPVKSPVGAFCAELGTILL